MPNERDRSEEERRKRLAAALRDNLKRRKAQDRARRAQDPPTEGKPPRPAGEPPEGS
ncbi:hypothetical protein [uncultured Alsobacter sp.]|uniref:hypothetical protein n=1 Tax=uncultured Alsobacter sp. TaxID=1748258 RepID=UPI0025D42C3A|nr:hypothetical protein [uncultured Alsobacter sp.]